MILMIFLLVEIKCVAYLLLSENKLLLYLARDDGWHPSSLFAILKQYEGRQLSSQRRRVYVIFGGYIRVSTDVNFAYV
jgi:hypothetical protein